MNLVDILKTDKEKKKFSELLIEEFQKYGYGTLSKNDLQDLLIFCLNTASDVDFLAEYSNYELAKSLKTTDTRIKNMRMNIAQKYDSLDSRQQLEKLFRRIIEGKIKLTYDYIKREISLGIENNVIKRELETIAKELGHTLNYKRNREIVVMEMDLFLDIVEYLNNENDYEIYNGIIKNEIELRKQMKSQEFREKVKTEFKEISKSISKEIVLGIISGVLGAQIL